MSNSIIKTIYLGDDPFDVARVNVRRGLDSVEAQQADLATITREVYFDDDTPASGPSSLVIADVVFDTLQLGTVWTLDKKGFNFFTRVSHTILNAAGEWRIRYIFATTSGDQTNVWFYYRVLDQRPVA